MFKLRRFLKESKEQVYMKGQKQGEVWIGQQGNDDGVKCPGRWAWQVSSWERPEGQPGLLTGGSCCREGCSSARCCAQKAVFRFARVVACIAASPFFAPAGVRCIAVLHCGFGHRYWIPFYDLPALIVLNGKVVMPPCGASVLRCQVPQFLLRKIWAI